MDVKMKSKILALVIASAFLQGCSSDEVELVKNGRLEYDSSYNIGDAFDNRDLCESTSWAYTEDNKGRKVVEYQCSLAGGNDLIEALYKRNEKSLADTLNSKVNAKQQKINSLLSNIDNDRAAITKYESGIKSIEEKLNRLMSEDSPALQKAQADVDWLKQGGIDERFRPYWQNIKTQEAFIKKGDSVEHRQKLIDDYKAEAEEMRGWIIESAETELLALTRQEEAKLTTLKSELKQLSNAKEIATSNINDNTTTLSKIRPKLEEEIKALEADTPEYLDEFKDKFYSGEPSITEFFQWTVDDSSFYFASAGIRLIRDDKIENTIEYGDRGISEVLPIVYQKPISFSTVVDSKFYFYKVDWLFEKYKQ